MLKHEKIESIVRSGNFKTSSIVKLELLGWNKITESEFNNISNFLSQIEILHLSDAILDIAIRLKRNSNLKVPEAVIAATSIYNNLQLVTNDKDFYDLPDLQIAKF
jgi:predicted nucleic acid-binding protein